MERGEWVQMQCTLRPAGEERKGQCSIPKRRDASPKARWGNGPELDVVLGRGHVRQREEPGQRPRGEREHGALEELQEGQGSE